MPQAPLNPVDRLHGNGGDGLIAGLGQLHVFAASGLGEILAHATADELALGVDHQQLQAQGPIFAGHLLHLLLEVHRLLTLQLGLAEGAAEGHVAAAIGDGHHHHLTQIAGGQRVGPHPGGLGEAVSQG